jgi:heme oxygenase (biliverdin-IX-beta and delta-forming)
MYANAHTASSGSKIMVVFKNYRMILKQLKEATRERHMALERQLPLLSPHLTLLAYRQLTRRFFGFYAPLELKLLNSPSWKSSSFDYSQRLKTPSLRHDLLALGDSPEILTKLERCKELPCLDSPAQVAGCLYVIEGATLGGQIITKHLCANLGITPQTGASFFGGYGTQTGSLWLGFCDWVRSRTELASHSDYVIATANETFAKCDDWLFPKACAGVTSQGQASQGEPSQGEPSARESLAQSIKAVN